MTPKIQNENQADAQESSKPTRKFDDLPPAAQRALNEADERRKKLEAEKANRATEIGGRGGEDPARFGDWEVKGIAIDF